MANPTTNYGFVLPTSTDLVTDLPADFDVALQGVDTRLKALQPGTTLGDLFYASATANTNTRLGIGSNGQVLSITSGVPAWTTTADVTPLTTKGDLFTFTTVDARLAVGANDTVLTADSTAPTGLKWATASSGGMTLINSGGTSLTGASVTISAIPATYNYLYLEIVSFKPATDNAQLGLRFNADSGANRYYRSDIASGVGATAFNATTFYLSAGQDNGSDNCLVAANIYGYANTATWKMASGYGLGNNDGTPAQINYWTFGGFYNQTAAITSLTLAPSAGNFTSGTAYLYGVK